MKGVRMWFVAGEGALGVKPWQKGQAEDKGGRAPMHGESCAYP